MTTRRQDPPKEPDKTPQELQAMAPAERDAYLQKKAEEGVDSSSPLFGWVQEFMARAQAKNQSQQMGDKNVAEATKGRDVEYVQGLHAPNADYKGTDHTHLQAFLESNLNVEQVSDVSTAYHKVHQVFDKFATSMNTAVNASKGTWEGSAAENAQQYFTSLGKWSDANSQNAKLASETIYDQGQAASTAKNSMPAPIPFSWKDEFKGWVTSNPFSLADNVDQSIQKQKDSQAAHDQAAGVMSTYDKNLYEAASKQPAFAPPPSFSTGGGSGDPNGTGDKNGINTPSSVNMPGSHSVNTPGGTSNFVPGTTGTPQFSGPGSTTGSGFVPSGTTTPSSFTPGSVPGGSTSNPNQQFGGMPPMSPMPMGGMNLGGDEAYNSKVGGGSGSGRGGGGFGPGGAGAGNATGAGAASGAARPGGIGAAEAAAGRGMGGLGAGAGGRGGGMGPGGGMGRGQKGEGDEDTEHSRPTYLVEGDPDEVFGTDMRTAPPVIGE